MITPDSIEIFNRDISSFHMVEENYCHHNLRFEKRDLQRLSDVFLLPMEFQWDKGCLTDNQFNLFTNKIFKKSALGSLRASLKYIHTLSSEYNHRVIPSSTCHERVLLSILHWLTSHHCQNCTVSIFVYIYNLN